MIKAIAQIIICAIAFYQQAIAQIIVANKGMEGFSCVTRATGSIDSFEYTQICSLSSYFLCDTFIAIVDAFTFNPPNFYPSVPYSGNTCLMLSDVTNKLKGSVSTKIECSLKKNKQYKISYWASNVWNWVDTQTAKTFEIWGNLDTCNRIEKLWESEPIGIGWIQYKAFLLPKLQDYEYLNFRIGISSNSYDLLLDSLSDIYPFNGNDVTT
ncbi:MAG TPA: hypothetical protein PL084_08680, partial [Chitinophagales bacterium]|nr:hypothetical protein [Chitinophagales bacterium]